MKIKHYTILLLMGLLISVSIFSQQNTTNKTLVDLLERSKLENKKLFLVFGWEGCSWCRVYDKYHADSEVKEILNEYFYIAKIDISKTKEGKELYKTYGKGGTPSWTIFNKSGEVLIDSDIGNGNIGFPATEKELNDYLLAIKTAAPELRDADGQFLISKLKDFRKRKSQGEFKI